MGKTRSESRKDIMTILYQINVYEVNKVDYSVDEVINNVLDIDNEFVKDVVYGVITYKSDIDKVANENLKDWTIDRLGNTDQAILRMAIYEIIYTDTPDIVCINEAIELAKKYSDDKVKNMINACLDKIYHQRLDNE